MLIRIGNVRHLFCSQSIVGPTSFSPSVSLSQTHTHPQQLLTAGLFFFYHNLITVDNIVIHTFVHSSNGATCYTSSSYNAEYISMTTILNIWAYQPTADGHGGIMIKPSIYLLQAIFLYLWLNHISICQLSSESKCTNSCSKATYASITWILQRCKLQGWRGFTGRLTTWLLLSESVCVSLLSDSTQVTCFHLMLVCVFPRILCFCVSVLSENPPPPISSRNS